MPIPTTVRHLQCFILFALCITSGCSHEQGLVDETDPDEALDILVTSLETWKRGETGTLSQRQPPIRFVDDDLAAGRKLDAYHIHDPESGIAPFENVYVTLTLRTAAGQTLERKVGYQVALTPALAVLRSEP